MDESSRCDRCTDSRENVHEYEEHRVIGKGAYGVVYLVTHIPSNIQASILCLVSVLINMLKKSRQRDVIETSCFILIRSILSYYMKTK